METVGPRRKLISDAKMMAEITSTARLREAWTKVWKNEGAAGGDGVNVQAFQRGVVLKLADLALDLDRGTYMPGPVRRVVISKESGGTRPLDIPCIRDRVVQTAIAMTLGPELDREFEPSSFGYRPGRSVQQAVDRVSMLHRHGFTHVVDADIERFFERVDHDLLMARLAESMKPGPLTALIGQWLEHSAPAGKGLAQGSPLSPLLSNLYLDRLDETLSTDGLAIVRFADDFVVLARGAASADAALNRVSKVLARHGLELNADKTRVTSFDAGFRFLGHIFVRSFALADPDGDLSDLGEELRGVARRDAQQGQKQRDAESDVEKSSRAGLDPGQRILYLTRGGRQLTTSESAFLVRESLLRAPAADTARLNKQDDGHWRDLIAIHAGDVDRIEIGAATAYDHSAVELAMASGTEIAFVNGHGETMGWVTAGHDGRAARQMAQAAAALDDELCLGLARVAVEAQLRNRRALLRRLNRNRADPALTKPLARLNHIIRQVPHAQSLNVLRGLEGHGAAHYWPAFGRMLDHGFSFRIREREKANAPNIMLNFTAHMLARDCRVALVRAGLNVGFGMLHSVRNHGEAAVYDLMEPFRAPLAEAAVSLAVNQRVVSVEQFNKVAGKPGVRMQKDATRGLIRTRERLCENTQLTRPTGRARTWRALITDAAIGLAQAVEARDATLWRPHVMDY